MQIDATNEYLYEDYILSFFMSWIVVSVKSRVKTS